MNTTPIARDLVLLGGGHSHVLLLRMLGMNPIPGLQVTLITPDVLTPYSGMLPGVVSGHYSEKEIHIDLVPLCKFAGARFICVAAYDIDPVMQVVKCKGRADFNYDLLSIDIGITPAVSDVPGAAEHAIAVKPINKFLAQWQQFLERWERGLVKQVAVVGGGAGGVELCFAIAHRLKQQPGIHLLVDGAEILSGYDDKTRVRVTNRLNATGIKLQTGCRVEEITETERDKKCLLTRSGDQLEVDEVFWVTSAAGQSWLAGTGIALTEKGFLSVEPTLQSSNYPNIFAVGDVADVIKHPRPKAGVFAVRQGPPLFENIARLLSDKAPKAFKPQQSFLSLLATGDKYAIASKHGWSVEGRLIWRWKDWIDRGFMARFSSLPKMKRTKPKGLLAEFDDQMQCGGCGSKVSADLLRDVLFDLDVDVDGLDDAAIFEVPAGKMMLHTVDSFKSFIDDPYVFSQVAVNHALSDIYAMLGQPVTALAIITLPHAKPDRSKALLTQIMAGIIDQLQKEGVKLIGGHTSEGAELSIGFAVNGLIDGKEGSSNLGPGTINSGITDANKRAKQGARLEDKLILSKPLGTGTLFAANMQYKAEGQWIQQATEMMLTSNRDAAHILKDANACTDVTGFGLAGHLMEMLKSDNLHAEINLDQLPLLEGAQESINKLGVKSTLHDANQRSAPGVDGFTDHPAFPILFDPQTAGGLLAAVDSASAEDLVAQLNASGCLDAKIIGSIKNHDADAGPRITVR